MIWTERLGEKMGIYASPILVNGKIYCGTQAGECLVWEAAEQFKLVARNPLGEGSNTPACVDGGRLYLKTFTHLICIGK